MMVALKEEGIAALGQGVTLWDAVGKARLCFKEKALWESRADVT